VTYDLSPLNMQVQDNVIIRQQPKMSSAVDHNREKGHTHVLVAATYSSMFLGDNGAKYAYEDEKYEGLTP
jgi:hypothetical protein